MLKKLMLALAATAIAAPALAHVSLEVGEAPVGSTYKAVFRVPHGCEGQPTNVVRVRIPEGVISVKPMPKAGWELEKVRGEYGKSYEYYGSQVSEGVKEVVWSGGNLGDDEYDEFVLRGYFAANLKEGDAVYFPVVQECPGGLVERWIDITAEVQIGDDLEMPAPAVTPTRPQGGH